MAQNPPPEVEARCPLPLLFRPEGSKRGLSLSQIRPCLSSLSREAAMSPFVLFSTVWDDLHTWGKEGGPHYHSNPSMPLLLQTLVREQALSIVWDEERGHAREFSHRAAEEGGACL